MNKNNDIIEAMLNEYKEGELAVTFTYQALVDLMKKAELNWSDFGESRFEHILYEFLSDEVRSGNLKFGGQLS